MITVYVSTTVYCDGSEYLREEDLYQECKVETDALIGKKRSNNIRRAWHHAQREGWNCKMIDGELKHFCPSCWGKVKYTK